MTYLSIFFLHSATLRVSSATKTSLHGKWHNDLSGSFSIFYLNRFCYDDNFCYRGLFICSIAAITEIGGKKVDTCHTLDKNPPVDAQQCPKLILSLTRSLQTFPLT